jgi:hypothetical protein
MKSGSITPEQKAQSTRVDIPNLVTEDDLKHELGEYVVALLQKSKAIRLLGVQLSKQNALLIAQKAEIDKLPAIQRSNNQLDDKNRKLAETLTGVRVERDAAVSDKAVALASESAAVTGQTNTGKLLIECKNKVDRLQGLYDGSQESRVKLNDIIDNNEKDIAALKEEIKVLKKKPRKKPHKAA